VARGGVRYILVCYDVFSKHVKLYALKAATTRSCLNKLVNHYFTQVIKPKCILSDNGTQFQSPLWKEKLAEHNVQVRFTPIRHPQANTSDRCMRKISKFCKIYCSKNYRKWAELLPKIEEWLNTTVADTTGFTPVEMLFQAKKPDLFEKIFTKSPKAGDKVMKAYARMRKKAKDRRERRKKGNKTWELKVSEKVLVRAQPASDVAVGITAKFIVRAQPASDAAVGITAKFIVRAQHASDAAVGVTAKFIVRAQHASDLAVGVTAKFIHPYEGPYVISRMIPPSTYGPSTTSGKGRGEFNKKILKPYLEEETSNVTGSN